VERMALRCCGIYQRANVCIPLMQVLIDNNEMDDDDDDD